MKNKITQLFSIKYPIIQAGMVWCSGWRLASAVSNNGGLGIIGSGSMRPDVLREHIQKCRANTQCNFAVNLPLLFPYVNEHIDVIIQENVPIVFTSAGNPEIWTKKLKNLRLIMTIYFLTKKNKRRIRKSLVREKYLLNLLIQITIIKITGIVVRKVRISKSVIIIKIKVMPLYFLWVIVLIILKI